MGNSKSTIPRSTSSKKNDDKRYVVCPVCGGLLAKSNDGTSSQQSCHRCGWALEYTLDSIETGFVLTIRASSKEQVAR